MMRYLGALGLTALLFVCSLAPAEARSTDQAAHARVRSVVKTFRLRVSGRPVGGMTYWVAYGPLADHFGLVRLRPAGHMIYQASERMPADGRTTFVYLAGHGSIHTRFGQAPADPVITIKAFGPLAVNGPDLPQVRWQAPAG